MIKRILKFIEEGIWNIRVENYHPVLAFLVRQLRIILMAIKGFKMNRIKLRASALTYYTVLSVVPIAAMVFGIAKGFGFEDKLEAEIRLKLAAREEFADVMEYIIEFAQNMLASVNGGVIAGAGVILLFWSIMSVLGNIERSFNAIWRIKKSRAFVRKFSDYLSLMLIAPIILFLSSTVTVFISDAVTQSDSFIQVLGPVVQFLVNLIPYTLIFLLFTLLYVIMPNTKVSFKSGLYAGLIAGIIFQLTQWVYVNFQVGISKYNSIYSGFAALPLFLIWLQTSWLIVLLGAEISFAFQNIGEYELDSESVNVNPYNKRLLTFLIIHLLVKRFSSGQEPLTSEQISHDLGIPIRLARDILFDLTESNLIIEVTTESPKERSYVPSMDINKLSISFVVEKLERRGEGSLMAEETEDLKVFTEIQQGLLHSISTSPANRLIKDI